MQSNAKVSCIRRTYISDKMKWDFGQGLVEYALIISLVAVVVVIIAAIFGSAVKQAFCEPLVALDPEENMYCLVEDAPPIDPEEEDYPIYGRANYSSYRNHLYIIVRVPEETSPTLTVEGYGVMEYVPYRNAYRLVIHTHDPPSTVNIISSDGPSITLDVTRHW